MVQPALQDDPRRSRGVLGPSFAENRPKTGPEISGQTAFRYPVITRCRRQESKANMKAKRAGADPKATDTAPYEFTVVSRVIRGCTLGGYKMDQFFKDRKSVILEVWAAPGAPETLPQGGGLSPPPSGMFKKNNSPGPKPCKFIRFGDIHGPKPHKFIRFENIHGPKPYCKVWGHPWHQTL